MNLLVRAYSVRPYQVIGPDWLDNERFEFAAKLTKGGTRPILAEMLQQALETRFGLKIHRETRELPVFRLVVAKNGPKLHRSQSLALGSESTQSNQFQDVGHAIDADGFPVIPSGQRQTRTVISFGRPHMTARARTMDELAVFLSGQIDRPVVNATGLIGEYDFKLTWAPSDRPPEDLTRVASATAEPIAPAVAMEADGPSFVEAIQGQLGLKLVPGKGPVDVLVIDSVRKMPTAN